MEGETAAGPYVHTAPLVRHRPLQESLLSHDAFAGKTTPYNKYALSKDRVGVAEVPKKCTGFAAFMDVYMHGHLRPLVEDEVLRRLKLHDGLHMNAKAWTQLFVISFLTVWFNPMIASPAHVAPQMVAMGLSAMLDGSQDHLISMRVVSSRISMDGLQARVLLRLAELARVTVEQERQALAKRARIWQDTRNWRAERQAVKEEKNRNKEARFQTDSKRYESRVKDGLGPRGPDSDSSEGLHQQGESKSEAMEESKESAEEEQLFDTIKETMPPGHHICKTIPTLDASLVGRCIAFRWDLVWEQGRVTKFHSTDPQAARRKKKRKVDILEANFEVEFISDAYPRDVLLTAACFTARTTRTKSSWACFETNV
jgi:hypothetical protein